MSKIPVIYQNENIFDKQMLCPHNKIVGKVQKIYRVEKPVRLKDVSHLRKIGQCDCPICDNSNKLLCECPWKKEKFFHNNTNTNNNTNKLQQQYGVASGGRGTIASTRRLPGINDEKTKNESIFRFHTMPPPDDYDEYPLKEMQHSGPMTNLLYNNTTLGGCRSTLMKKFRQGYRKSYNYLAGRIKSNESFNWIMKPITDFRISTVDIIGLQTNYLTQTPNKFLNMGKQNHLQQTISGTYKQPIDKSSGSSGLQQQQQKQHQQQKHYGSSNYKKSNRKNRMNYNSKNSSIEDDSDIQNVGNSFDHELMPAIMSNHVNKMYDLIKSSITNSRYLRSIANKYPPNMLPDRSEQEATVSGTIPIETIKARTTHTYHHQSHQYKQHEKQQQQRSQQQHQRPSQQCQSHQQPSQRIFVEPCTTIEVYDNKIDLGQIQYKAPLSSSTKQRCTVITNINSKSKTSEKEGIIAVNNDNDKIKLSCAKATNLSGDNFDVNDDFNCDVSIPSIIAVPDDALVKMEIQKNSFQSFNSSIISSHNSKNQLNRNTFIANSCNVKEVMSSSAGTNMKSNQIVTVTSHTKRADPNSIKNETTNNNSTNSKKIDGNGTMHKNINVKKSKDKNSKVSMKKRRVKK